MVFYHVQPYNGVQWKPQEYKHRSWKLAEFFQKMGGAKITSQFFFSVFRILDILVRIRMRIFGSVPLINGSGCGSGSVPKFSATFRNAKKSFLFFLCFHKKKFKSFKIVKICLMIKSNFSQENFCIKILFWNYYLFQSAQRKRKGFGSVPVINGSGCGSWRPKNIPYGSCGSGTLFLRFFFGLSLPCMTWPSQRSCRILKSFLRHKAEKTF